MEDVAMNCSQEGAENCPSSAESEEEKEVVPILPKSSDDPLLPRKRVKSTFDFGLAREEESSSGKRKLSKELFPREETKAKCEETSKEGSSSIVPYAFQSLLPALPLLNISQISNSNLRFAFEGKVLTVYGTFRSPKDFKKYLKADLGDREGHATITLVITEGFIPKFVDQVQVNACLHIEGVNVAPKNCNDGGSAAFSLHVDATTQIIKAEPFDVHLMFVPEIKICKFLLNASRDPSLKATIAFVVIQVDKVLKSGGLGSYEQLTIADGPRPMDLATLSFVNQRKSDYHDIVAQFQMGNIVMFVARNIGVFKDKFNTLSILDVTLLAPVFGAKRRLELEGVFRIQISEMGYGKEVYGTLELTNFNSAFIVKKCAICKGSKVNKLDAGGYCFVCSKSVDIIEAPLLEGKITSSNGTIIDVTLVGESVDKVLQLEDCLVNLYHKDVIGTKELLSEFSKIGNFLIDKQGCVIGFNSTLAST